MANAAKIQAKIYAGYGKAAKQLGVTCSIYRDIGLNAPISSATLVGTTLASFSGAGLQGSRAGFNYNSSSAPNEVFNHVLIDGRLIQVGDYLVTDSDTYFVGSMDLISPIMAVKCLHTLSVMRPDTSAVVGADPGYSGAKSEADYGDAIPCTLVYDRIGKSNPTGLPGEVPGLSDWRIYVSRSINFIQRNDVVVDDLGRRFQIRAAYITNVGYQLVAQLIEV